jgi:hypothetical protein
LEGEGNIGNVVTEEAIQEDGEAVQNQGEATQGATSQVTQIEPTVTAEASGSNPKKRRGRPRGKKVQPPVTEPVFEDEVLADQVNTNQNVGQASIVRDRGLSDEEEYNSDVLESGAESEDEEENGGSKLKFATFKKPENMRDYEWEVGTYFVSKKEFQDAVRTFAVHAARDLKFDKNDKRRVKVICRGNQGKCESQMYCVKIPGEETWQLRRIKGKHTCSKEYKLRIMNSDWLGDKLHSRVKENPDLKLKSIINRAHEKWNLGVCWSKAYRARAKAIDLVDGSFREQYTRIYDYAHELLRSNKESTVCVTTNPFQGSEEDLETPGAVFFPHFQRLYICLKGCKDSFFKCRKIIGLDGCFLKGYYGGMLLAAIGRDPNDQMLPIAYAVVEGETKESWKWFLELLIADLGGSRLCKTYTFISDQQKVILIYCRLFLQVKLHCRVFCQLWMSYFLMLIKGFVSGICTITLGKNILGKS